MDGSIFLYSHFQSQLIILGIFLDSLGILWEFFGISLGIIWDFFGNSLGTLWEFFVNCLYDFCECGGVAKEKFDLMTGDGGDGGDKIDH